MKSKIIVGLIALLIGSFGYAGGWGVTPGSMYQDWLYVFKVQPVDGSPEYTVRYLVTHGAAGFNQRQTASGVVAAEDACSNGHPGITHADGTPFAGYGHPCRFVDAVPLVPENYHGAAGSSIAPPFGFPGFYNY